MYTYFRYYLDDGHGDYNRSYEQPITTDYADYSTDRRDNNFRNYSKVVGRKQSDRKRAEEILRRYQ